MALVPLANQLASADTEITIKAVQVMAVLTERCRTLRDGGTASVTPSADDSRSMRVRFGGCEQRRMSRWFGMRSS